jgi:hypothetical protein
VRKAARASTREKDEEQPVLVSMPGFQKERARASTREEKENLSMPFCRQSV